MKGRKFLVGFLVIWFLLGLLGFVWSLANGGCCTQFFGSQEKEQAGVQYRSVEYGFSFDLPESWKGYLIVASTWEGRSVESGEVVATGPMISIRHPLWTEDVPRQDIPIMVFAEKEWSEVLAGRLSLGAAPIPPSELGQNDDYIFALPARYNFAFPEGYEEVEEILRGDPLQAI